MGINHPGLDRLRADLVQEIQASEARTVQRFEAIDVRFEAIDVRFETIDTRFESADAKFDAADTRMRERFEVFEARLRAHIDTRAAETRRHFDVVGDGLQSQIQVVAEGVVALDEKVERFRGEVQENFARVDRRLLHLETRVSGLEHR
jgi:hypothetical protein